MYELLLVDFSTQPPTFSVKCDIDKKYAAIGNGSNKKLAKHRAAFGVLKNLSDSKIDETLKNLM